MKRALAVATILGFAAIASAKKPPAKPPAHKQAGAENRSTLTVEPAGRSFKKLTIENPLGDVRVEGYDGKAIQIETNKFAPDLDILDRLRISLIPNSDGTVRIATTAEPPPSREHRAPRSAVRIDLVVRAPRDARIEAIASAGKIEVINMDAGGDLDTGSGSISVRNMQGTLFTEFRQLVGTPRRCSARSMDAVSDVDLDSINGEHLVASVNRGKIAGRRVRARDVELTTTEGKIFLEAEASLHGHLVVSSMKGDVDVRLRRMGPVMVRARGTKVSLGMPSQVANDGWTAAMIGELSSTSRPALVELRSQTGIINFELAVIPPTP